MILEEIESLETRKVERMADPGPDPLAQLSEVELRRFVADLMGDFLTPKQITVIGLRYAGEHTFTEIGARLGITNVAACRIHGRALDALREALHRRQIRKYSDAI